MNKQELQELTRKYDLGDTSVEEEKKLFQYFNGKNCEGVQEAVHAQFRYFKYKREEGPSVGLKAKLNGLSFTDPKQKYISYGWILKIAAALVVCAGVGWFLAGNRSPGTSQKVVTKALEQKIVVLPDSTVVWLNENTALEYDNIFNNEERIVRLSGEAYFDVKRDPSKPFIVKTGKVTTEVTGTSFNLRDYRGEETVELNVVTGSVKFGSDQKVEVRQGTSAYFDMVRQNIETSVLRRNANAWKTRQLIFDDAPMLEVVRDLERYFQINIEVEDPSMLKCHFKGNFIKPDVESILKVVSYSLNIQYSVTNKGYKLSGQNCAAK